MHRTVFRHVAIEVDPSRVHAVRDALRAVVERFDFVPLLRLEQTEGRRWRQELHALRDPRPAELAAVLGELAALVATWGAPTPWARMADGTVEHTPRITFEVPAALPDDVPTARWGELRDAVAHAARLASLGAPALFVQGRLRDAVLHAEAVLGRIPALPEEPEATDPVAFEWDPFHPLRLWQALPDLLTWCAPPGARAIGVEDYASEPEPAAAAAEPDPRHVGAPTDAEIAHHAQPPSAHDRWRRPALWSPPGLALPPVVDPAWHPHPEFAQAWPRPLTMDLTGGPPGFAAGAALAAAPLREPFASRCREVAARGRGVVSWIDVVEVRAP